MTFLMYLADPKDHILKDSRQYLHFWLKYKHLKIRGTNRGMAQWVIHDILDVPCRAQGSYPESFEALSSFLAEIYAFETSGVQTGVQTGVRTMGHPGHSGCTL